MAALIDPNYLSNKGFALFKKACDEAPNEEVFKAVQKMGEEFEKLIKSAPTVEVPSWTPVTERLPKEEDRSDLGYILVIINGFSSPAKYNQTHGFLSENGVQLLCVTHWMPMPKALQEII